MAGLDHLRVLIVRLGAMGDILHALPAITALRAAQPGWFLGWAVEPQWQALLSTGSHARPGSPAMPLVDQLHLVPAKRWARRPLSPRTLGQILLARGELRAARYDLAVDLQGAVRSAIVARWARPDRVYGEAKPREAAARWLFTDRIATTGAHVVEQAAELVGALAPAVLDPTSTLPLPLLPVDPEAEAWCANHAPSSPFALICPGAGWGAKRWPPQRYAAVAAGLVAAGVPVVINAGPSEQSLGDEVAKLALSSAASTAGHAGPPGVDSASITVLLPTLAQLISLVRRATLAIAGDTGPLHLAAGLGLPTVAIFGPTDPARNGPFHGQAAGRHAILRHPESRRDHARRSQPEAGLLTITSDEVLAAAHTLLAACASTAGRNKAHA